MGMNAICPSCGHAERSDNHRGARLGVCPQCGTPMRAHTAGRAKGRYICPIRVYVFTFGLGGSRQLTEPMRLVFQPGQDLIGREPDPDNPGWMHEVYGLRSEPDKYEQGDLDRLAGRVLGPGCVVGGQYKPYPEGHIWHGRAQLALVPAPDADPASWFVNEPVRYKKCAACPKKVVASDKTRIDREWVPARESYWQGSGRRMRRVEIKPGPHPAGTYACPDCRPQGTDPDSEPQQPVAGVATATATSQEDTTAPDPAPGEPPRGSTQTTTAEQGFSAGVQDGGYAAIHDAVARLAGVCDFAESQDGHGFNATDTWLGHALAAMPATEWTADQALTAWDMLRKYSGQLDGFGMPHGGLPRPPGAGELEVERRAETREHARQQARRWRGQQYRRARSYVRCDGEGEQVTLAFAYDPELVSQARAIKGRSFDWDTKDNVYLFTSLPQVVALAEAHGIDIAAEVRALVPVAAASARQEAARPDVYTDPAGRVVIKAEYDPQLNEALKELNGGRSTWDRTARVHVAPVHRDPARVLAVAGEFGLAVGEDARAAITGEQDRQDRNEAAGTAFEAAPVPIPGLADGLALKPQQYPVVRFAAEHRRVLIGDGMGWGKTLSSLAAVAADSAYPAVVVCRPSLTLNWVAEIRRFFPTLAVHEASGTTPQPIPTGTDVIVIGSAALAAKPHKTRTGGKEFGWVKTLAAAAPKALIIDEGQDTKERAANRSQACEQLAMSVIGRDGLVLDLTGTAILNRPRELCQQLSILGRIGEFGGPKAFMWRYWLSEVNEWGASYDGARNLIELHDRLLRWGIMIRRADDAKLGLPPCREHVLRVPQAELDPAVMARYRRAEADLLAFLADQARQAAERLGQDPASAAVQATVRASAAEHLVAINTLRQLAGQAKRGYVTTWIGEHVAAGEKVMVAAHHRDEVDAYAEAFGGLKLQGGQTVADKEAAKAAFQNQPASQAPVIAVAIGAGGVGHTLTAAATGIQAEQAWTPGETQQMKKRLHRIGQDRPVDYYITVAADTIDEHLWDVVTTKQATLDAVLDGRTDHGTADDDKSVTAELAWRLTQQSLASTPESSTGQASQPGPHEPTPDRARNHRENASGDGSRPVSTHAVSTHTASKPPSNDPAEERESQRAAKAPDTVSSVLGDVTLARLRAEAAADRSPFIDPALLREAGTLLTSVDRDWLSNVIGHSVTSYRLLNNAELSLAVRAARADAPHLQALADARLAEVRRAERLRAEAAAAKARAQQDGWEALRNALPVPVKVSHNWTARHLDGYEQGADHIVVLEDLHIGRLHREARSPLCWTPSRTHELRHVSGNLDDENRLPDCKACLRHAQQLAAAGNNSGAAIRGPSPSGNSQDNNAFNGKPGKPAAELAGLPTQQDLASLTRDQAARLHTSNIRALRARIRLHTAEPDDRHTRRALASLRQELADETELLASLQADEYPYELAGDTAPGPPATAVRVTTDPQPAPGLAGHGEPGECDPDAALDAYYAQREYESGGGKEDAIAFAALDAQPDATIVEFVNQGERFFAIRTGPDERAVRHETEYDPAEFPAIRQDAVPAGATPEAESAQRRILVTGSRTWTDTAAIREALRQEWGDGTTVLVTGTCPRGADAIAEQQWQSWGGRVERYPADWSSGRDAGMRCNADMVGQGADICLAFIRGNSPGASHTARLAQQAGIPTRRFETPPTPAREPASVPPGENGNPTPRAQPADRPGNSQPGQRAAQDGDDDDAGSGARVTRHVRTCAGHTMTVYAPRPGELDAAAFTAFTAGQAVLGLDVETSALRDDGPRQFGKDFTVRLVQFGSEDAAWVLNLADPAQRDAAVRVLADPARRFVTHTPYDVLAVWSVSGIALGQRVIDTHLLSKLVNPDERAGHGLKQLASRHLDDGLAKAEEALHKRMWAAAPASQRNGAALARWGWNHLPADDEDYVVYAGLDAIYARRLLPVLTGRCAPFAHLIRAESWLAAQATGITIRGLQLDQPYTRALLATLEAEHAAAEAVITARLGCPGASPRFAAWLDEQTRQAGITGLARTETGQLQVTDATLTALLDEQGAVLPAHVAEMARQRLVMSKTANLIANLRGFLTAADPAGRVHPQVNTLRAKTARMSITAPALQTLKKHDPRLRRCFRADPGQVLISCDFSQVEIRVAAALSRDPALLQAIGSGTDIHDATAALIYGRGFTAEQRTIAKRATFGAIYGGGARALAAQTGASEDAAREVISRWKNAYPGVAAYGRRMAELPEITTASGRRIPADPGRPYASANYAIQSTARDLLVAAIYTLVTEQKVGGLWLFVHDEIIVQAPERDAERVRGLLQQAMTGTFRGVPVLAEATILGPTWGRLDTPAGSAPGHLLSGGQGASPAHRQNVEPEPQAALFDITPLRTSTAVTGLTAGTFDPAASDRALTGDGYHWLDAMLPAPQPPTCETCGQAMRLPATAPILWACPACHGGEAGPADPSSQEPPGPPPSSRSTDSNRRADDGDDMDGQPRRVSEDSGTAQLRAFAHRYLDHGLLPVPAWAARHNGECCCRRGADCPRPGKHPRSVHTRPGQSDYSWKPLACHTHEEIDERFADGGEYAGANLMLAIPAGMMVIDQDNDDGGRQAITELAAALGELPPTLSHRTPHGRHLIYRTPPGWTGRAWVGKDTRNPLPAGIDLRMPGQILMASPSQVPGPAGLLGYGPPSGDAVTSLPAAYVTAWTPPRPTTRRPGRVVPVAPEAADRAASYVHKTITGVLADLSSHQPGGRNSAIYTAALKIGSMLGAVRTTPGAEHAAGGWTDDTAHEALMDAAALNGYVDAHGSAMARSAIRSGLRNGLRKPRALPDFTAKPQARQGKRGAGATPGRPPPNGHTGPSASVTGPDPGSTQPPRTHPAAGAKTVEVRRMGDISHVISGGQIIGRIHRDQDPRGTFYRAETATGPQATARDREVGRHLASIDDATSAIIAADVAAATPRPPEDAEPVGHQHGNRMKANRAALAADKAYRAGDLDQAQQHIDRAAVLDPSRAGLWQQHRTEIAAKRLFLTARQAQAEGNPDYARQLLSDAQELDPRMEMIWNRHLPQTRALRREPLMRRPAASDHATRHGGEVPASTRAGDAGRGNGPSPRWPGHPALRPEAATLPTRPAAPASPRGHTEPEEQAPANAHIAGPAAVASATAGWWQRANLGEARQRPTKPRQDPDTQPATPSADQGTGPRAPAPGPSHPGQGARADTPDRARRRVRADSVKPSMVVHNPYGGRRGRGVVASEARQMPDGTVQFDTEDGRTGHFRPGYQLDYDPKATEALAAERETRRHAQPQHAQPSPPTASPAPSERGPNQKPPSREDEHEEPAVVETVPVSGSGTERSSPTTRGHQPASGQEDAVDWRDTLSSSERNTWQPRPIQPGSLPMPAAEAKGLEIGN